MLQILVEKIQESCQHVHWRNPALLCGSFRGVRTEYLDNKDYPVSEHRKLHERRRNKVLNNIAVNVTTGDWSGNKAQARLQRTSRQARLMYESVTDRHTPLIADIIATYRGDVFFGLPVQGNLWLIIHCSASFSPIQIKCSNQNHRTLLLQGTGHSHNHAHTSDSQRVSF